MVSITSRSVSYRFRRNPVPLSGVNPCGERERRSGAPESYVLTAHSLRFKPAKAPEDEKWPEVCRIPYLSSPYPLPRTSENAVQAKFTEFSLLRGWLNKAKKKGPRGVGATNYGICPSRSVEEADYTMKMEILYFDGCQTYLAVEKTLREVLEERGIAAEVELVAVNTDGEARELRFAGSPTIKVDGEDLFPLPERAEYALGCRMYATSAGLRRSPTSAMLSEALAKKQGGSVDGSS
jgi:hypothetical protein